MAYWHRNICCFLLPDLCLLSLVSRKSLGLLEWFLFKEERETKVRRASKLRSAIWVMEGVCGEYLPTNLCVVLSCPTRWNDFVLDC